MTFEALFLEAGKAFMAEFGETRLHEAFSSTMQQAVLEAGMYSIAHHHTPTEPKDLIDLMLQCPEVLTHQPQDWLGEEGPLDFIKLNITEIIYEYLEGLSYELLDQIEYEQLQAEQI
jgi:hypothetical protein